MASEEPVFHIQEKYPNSIRIQRDNRGGEYRDFLPQDKEYQEIIELLNGLQYRRKEILKLSSGGGSAFLYAVELNYEEDNPPMSAAPTTSPMRLSRSTMSCITAIRKLWPSCRRIWGHDF